MFFDTFSALCKKRGVTPNKALVDCDISRTLVAKWKKGAIPNGTTLSKIADYFGVSTDYLLTGESGKEKTPTLEGKREEDITFDDFTYAMYNQSHELTEDEKHMLLALARTIAKERREKREREKEK